MLVERIKAEIERFDFLSQKLSSNYRVASGGPSHSIVLEPAAKMSAPKRIGLTVMAITHGNELAGLKVVNEVLVFLQKAQIKLSYPVCFALGNPAACSRNQRFIESDLNRSFGRQSEPATAEQRRARELEPLLRDSLFFLDIHQTREPSKEPFFIFPYTKLGLAFAGEIDRDIPVVTHWGKPFSKDGQCTDEYVNAQGGTGITIELGQNSFSTFSTGAGFRAVLKAILTVKEYLETQSFQCTPDQQQLYTWSEIIEYPSSGEARLTPGVKLLAAQ
jgi:succinylglutamate desuccinylase